MNDTATTPTPAVTSDEPIVPTIVIAGDDEFANEELGERQPGTCSLDGECDSCQ